jgi:hypothetical protein
MLRGIAEFAMRGRWYAAIATALFSLTALMLPPLSYLASGVIVLTTLRMGPKEGIQVVLATLVIFTLFAGLLLGQFAISVLFLISSWLPIFVATLVLGYTRSLAVSLLAAVGLGILVVIGIHLFITEPTLWWQQMLQPFFDMLEQQPGWQLSQSETQELGTNLAELMTGFVAAGVTINVIIGLLIGRAWQAKLYNPGGFAEEFRKLKLGKPAALVALFLMVVSLLPIKHYLTLLVDCLPAVLVVFAVQGLSIVHAIVKQQQKHNFWLVAVYVLLVVMMPQMVVILSMIGVLEQWMNFRRHSVE